jgi:hypothetical protein
MDYTKNNASTDMRKGRGNKRENIDNLSRMVAKFT